MTGRVLRIQVERYSETLDHIFLDGPPLPIRIVEAGAGADDVGAGAGFIVKYALEQPEDPLELPEAVTARYKKITTALWESLGSKTLGTFKGL
jgi:hypothetical protein